MLNMKQEASELLDELSVLLTGLDSYSYGDEKRSAARDYLRRNLDRIYDVGYESGVEDG